MTLPVTIADIEKAAAAIRGHVVDTPFPRAVTLSEITGADVALKLESFQFTASFKERGALNRLLQIPAQARAGGVVAASAGNHAQGVAHHARRLGIPVTIVMPETTPFSKITRTEALGATVRLRGGCFADAYAAAVQLAEESEATFVPAYDDAAIIAGQGTIGLEMLDARPDLDVVVVPVGGGGLISGIAIAAKARKPSIEVIGVQSADYPSMLAALGRTTVIPGGPTVAEGIAVEAAGTLTRTIVAALVDDLCVVGEEAIEEAMGLYLEIEKIVVEGAGAASLAALLEHGDRFRGRRCGLVVSGANVDLRMLSSVIMRALARSGRIVRLRIEIPDQPGVLARITAVIGEARGNIIDVTHRRDLPGVPLRDAILEVSVETRDRSHAETIVAALRAARYSVEVA